MTQPETYRYVIGPDEADPGFEMHVLSGPKNFLADTHNEEYQHVWRDGLINGDPGFVRQDVMTAKQVDDYLDDRIPKSFTPQRPDSIEAAWDASDTAVFTVHNDEAQMTAFARSGIGMTPGALELAHAQGPVCHVDNFEVADTTFQKRPLGAAERYAAGMVLAHSLALQAEQKGFVHVSYKVEHINRAKLYALAARLGLDEPQVLGYDAGMRHEVVNRFEASRTELATSVAGLVKALPLAEGLSYLNTRTLIRPA